MARQDGWAALFTSAFKQSRNAMVLLDEQRRQVDVNGAYLRLLGYRRDDLIGRPLYEIVAGGPRATPEQWAAGLAAGGHYTGDADLVTAGGGIVAVQWGADVEVVTGRRLVLLVVLSTSRWGGRFRRTVPAEAEPQPLSRRELDVLRLVASGNTGPEIADELRIAPHTVRTHVRNAMTKTGARSRAHLVAKALAEGHAFG